MDVTQTVILALIQGITEFLPISSSAHLILPFEVLGWPDQGLAFDVAVHVGSLSAVLVYFHRTLLQLLVGTWRALIQRKHNKDSRFAGLLIIASLPIIPVGFMLNDLVETSLRSVLVIATTTILFGIALWVADRYFRTATPKSLNWRSALVIGIAQCLALVPGTSRSGITMTAALMMGLGREAAARISFLLAIPTILGAGVLKTSELLTATQPVPWDLLALGTLVSAVSAFACIYLFLATISRIGFLPFVIYRLLLGSALLMWLML
ncbi:MAG: undecaprenyl-diphosphate phosphatase [Pseudomonadota bacterium]